MQSDYVESWPQYMGAAARLAACRRPVSKGALSDAPPRQGLCKVFLYLRPACLDDGDRGAEQGVRRRMMRVVACRPTVETAATSSPLVHRRNFGTTGRASLGLVSQDDTAQVNGARYDQATAGEAGKVSAGRGGRRLRCGGAECVASDAGAPHQMTLACLQQEQRHIKGTPFRAAVACRPAGPPGLPPCAAASSRRPAAGGRAAAERVSLRTSSHASEDMGDWRGLATNKACQRQVSWRAGAERPNGDIGPRETAH